MIHQIKRFLFFFGIRDHLLGCSKNSVRIYLLDRGLSNVNEITVAFSA